MDDYLKKYLSKPKSKKRGATNDGGPSKKKMKGLVIHDSDEDVKLPPPGVADEEPMNEEVMRIKIEMDANGLTEGGSLAIKVKHGKQPVLPSIKKEEDTKVKLERPETVYRTESGQKITYDDLVKQEEDRADAYARRKKQQKEERYEWGKGRVRVDESGATVAVTTDANRAIPKQHLAKYVDDDTINVTLKEAPRWNDPGKLFMKEKPKDESSSSKTSKRGKQQDPVYKGDFPANRFGIRPGYRWDGVDRSNGFEANYFKHQADKETHAERAYKWSTEDM